MRAREFDRVNLQTYGSRRAVRQYEAASGWLESGERASIDHVREKARDGAILDIGVGCGRTTPLLLEISSNYRAIDYCSAMIFAASRRFPTLSFAQMDARHLSFPENSFNLAVFSYNGIDSVDLPGRLEILHEVHRVVCANGYFVFSSLNRQGSAYAEHWPDLRVFRRMDRSPLGLLRAIIQSSLGAINWFRIGSAPTSNEDVAIRRISAHNFGLITLFVSVSAQIAQLRDCGFQTEVIFEPNGRRVASDGSEVTDAPWCYYVARKDVSAA